MRGDDNNTQAQGASRGKNEDPESGRRRLDQDKQAERKQNQRANSSRGSSFGRPLGRGGLWSPLPTKNKQTEHWEPPSFGNPHHCLRKGERERRRLGQGYEDTKGNGEGKVFTPKGLPLQGSPLGVKQKTEYLGPSWAKRTLSYTTNAHYTSGGNSKSTACSDRGPLWAANDRSLDPPPPTKDRRGFQ